ncbi:MAG TPA: hypothetical protein VF773_15955 [Verrucomicrobiae bacterium]
MDSAKKEILLELCASMATRLTVQDAHLEELEARLSVDADPALKQRLKLPRAMTAKLREELSFLQTNIQSEQAEQVSRPLRALRVLRGEKPTAFPSEPLATIIRACAQEWHLTPEAVFGGCKIVPICEARYTAIAAARATFADSRNALGDRFHLNSATIYNALCQFKSWHETDPRFRAKANTALAALKLDPACVLASFDRSSHRGGRPKKSLSTPKILNS